MEIDQLFSILLNITLVLLMFGLGMTVTTENFKMLWSTPQALLTGLGCQLLLLPIIGILVGLGVQPGPDIFAGLIILTLCPGGVTSNLFTNLAGGDTALSISLTAITSFITPFSIPLILPGLLNLSVLDMNQEALPLWPTMGKTVSLVLLPVISGMVMRIKNPQLCGALAVPYRRFSSAFLIIIIVLLCFKERAAIPSFIYQAGLTAFLLLAGSIMAAWLIAGKVVRLSVEHQLTIMIEVGIQNGFMAIQIANWLGSTKIAVFPAVYSIFMYGAVFTIIRWHSPRGKIAG